VPVPGIEEFTSELKGDSLRNPRILDECQVVTVIGEASHIADPRSLTEIEVEAIGVFESIDIKQWLVGIKPATLFLSKWVGPREKGGNAAGLELTRNVALAGAEDVRNSR
jgi:hypothetical protein